MVVYCFLSASEVPSNSDAEQVSSSSVRSALADGQMERVRKLLGRPHRLVIQPTGNTDILQPKRYFLSMWDKMSTHTRLLQALARHLVSFQRVTLHCCLQVALPEKRLQKSAAYGWQVSWACQHDAQPRRVSAVAFPS